MKIRRYIRLIECVFSTQNEVGARKFQRERRFLRSRSGGLFAKLGEWGFVHRIWFRSHCNILLITKTNTLSFESGTQFLQLVQYRALYENLFVSARRMREASREFWDRDDQCQCHPISSLFPAQSDPARNQRWILILNKIYKELSVNLVLASVKNYENFLRNVLKLVRHVKLPKAFRLEHYWAKFQKSINFLHNLHSDLYFSVGQIGEGIEHIQNPRTWGYFSTNHFASSSKKVSSLPFLYFRI